MATTYAIRTDVTWPSHLLLPTRPPTLAYIDMFGIINLAKVKGGTAPPGYDDLYDACIRARTEGRVLFPLSSVHVLETYNVGSVEQRRALVAVMEDLSGFHYLLGRPQVQELEIEAALNQIPGIGIAPQGPIPLIGPSALWAFGKRGGLRTNGPDPDAMARTVCEGLGIEAGDDAMAALNRYAERQLLTGPDDHHDPDLVAVGYTRQNWHDMLKARAKHEDDLARRLDTDPDDTRGGRLRDLVNANEMNVELNEALTRVTSAMNTTIGTLLDHDRTKLRDFADSMPTTRTAVSLKERYHRDSRHSWTTNDVNDIDALSIAVPYCDAVFTDKAARNGVDQSTELRLFGTALPRTPQAFTEWLDDQTAS